MAPKRPKIVLVTLGSRGDVFPYLGLGSALKQLGADCYLCTGIGFADDALNNGLFPATLNVDFRPLLSVEFIESTKSVSGLYRAWKSTRGFQDEFLKSLWETIKDIQPDLIVYHHNKGAPARYVGAAMEVPAIPTALIPAYLPTRAFRNPFTAIGKNSPTIRGILSHTLVSFMDFGLKQSVKKWCRKSLNLSGKIKGTTFDGYHPDGKAQPRLHLFSESILPKPKDWPIQDIITGYCFVDRQENWNPPQKLANFLNEGSPPIYIGFGSLPIAQLENLKDIVIKALAKTGHRGILMVGNIREEITDLPENIFAIGNVPHDWLFPKCAAIVHHGGIGTVHQAMRWGKPSIVCPMFLDQPFWGEIIHALGAGPQPKKFKHLSANQLAADIKIAMSPSCKRNAKEIGREMSNDDGLSKAAKIVFAELKNSNINPTHYNFD